MIIAAAALASPAPAPLAAMQVVQATTHLQDAPEERYRAELVQRREEIARWLGRYEVAIRQTAAASQIGSRLSDAIQAARVALDTPVGETATFAVRVERFNATQAALGDVLTQARQQGALRGEALRGEALMLEQTIDQPSLGALMVPIPQLQTIVPDVVFTIGFGRTFSSRSADIGSIDLATNLLGAAAGSAFDAIGAEAFATYLKQNISAGTSFPVNGGGKLSGQVGLGLGGLSLRYTTHDKPSPGKPNPPKTEHVVTVWPVLSIEQSDSADSRLPQTLTTRFPTEGKWSAPVFAIGFSWWDQATIERKIKAGKLVPVMIVGARLPYYYPGDAFTALGALFSGQRSKFEKEGKAEFLVGLAFPLLRVKPTTE